MTHNPEIGLTSEGADDASYASYASYDAPSDVSLERQLFVMDVTHSGLISHPHAFQALYEALRRHMRPRPLRDRLRGMADL